MNKLHPYIHGLGCGSYIILSYLLEKIRKNDVASAAQTVYVGVQLVHTLSLMIYPFLPRSSLKVWETLGLNGDPVSGGAGGGGTAAIRPGHKILPPSPLFTKVKVGGTG